MSLRLQLSALVFALALLPGCTGERIAGNSSETENTFSAREISVDSLYRGWLPFNRFPTVATLRLDSTNFDFSGLDSSGERMSVERIDGAPIPFERIFWDRSAQRGRLRVRLDPDLLGIGSRFRLRWGRGVVGRPAPELVWDSFPEYQKMLLTSLLLDDFERGTLLSALPDTATWHTGASDSATATLPRLASAGHGRGGNAIGFSFSANAVTGRYSYLTLTLSSKPVSLRALDSLVLWVRGSGNLWIALDRPEPGKGTKTWKYITLDTAWHRLKIAPKDFDSADGIGGNVGWDKVRDAITHLTFITSGAGYLWVDDIRMHGIVAEDLR